MTTENYEKWMAMAIGEAGKARLADELPIGGILVAGGEIVASTQTRVLREESIVAHGELMMLFDAKQKIYSFARPLVLFTTLEPCLMCLGAMIQCEIDELVYGMKCAPDGGLNFASQADSRGQRLPKVTGPILEKACVEEMQKWSKDESHPAYNYVRSILDPYDE